MKTLHKFWLGVIVLIVISPLGLLLPAFFKARGAWGEWGVEEIQGLVGYIPQGLKKLSSLWPAPIPNYSFKDWQGRGLSQVSLSYIVSAVLGVVVTVGIILLLVKIFLKTGNKRSP